jgi:xylulokinase
MANVLNIPLELPQTEEGPGYGAAMLAMVGCGEYDSVAECAAALVRTTETIEPDSEIAARYEAQYQKFRNIYPSVKNLFKKIK